MDDIEKNIEALEEILDIANEAFKGGVPEGIKEDLATIQEGVNQLNALCVYRDNSGVFKKLKKHYNPPENPPPERMY